MSLRLPQAREFYDYQNENLLRSKVEEILAHLFRSNETLRNDVDAVLPIEFGDFATGITPIEVVSALPTEGLTAGRVVFLTTDAKLYRYTGTAWERKIALDGDTDGTISAARVTADWMTAGVLNAGIISASHIASNRLSSLDNPSNIYIDFTTGTSGYFIKHPALSVAKDGTATFSGALSAATGTFAGTLSAVGGTFTGDITLTAGSSEITWKSGSTTVALAESFEGGTGFTGRYGIKLTTYITGGAAKLLTWSGGPSVIEAMLSIQGAFETTGAAQIGGDLTVVGNLSAATITGSYTVNANTLVGTTLASNVVNSSLTSVGTLTGLTVNGNVSITGTLSATSITGSYTVDAGDLVGTVLAGNVVTSSLTALGTLTGLTIDGNLSFTGSSRTITGLDSITVTTGNITTVAATTGNITTVNATTLNGSIGTASQPGITSVGTLSSLTIGGNLTFTGASRRLIPGTTDFSIRNNANSADNVLITDAGVVTVRSYLDAAALRVGATEIVTSGRALQNVTASTAILTSGTLGVARGGTGLGTFTTNALLLGNGTSALQELVNTSGAIRYLRSSAAGTPTWSTLNFSELTYSGLTNGHVLVASGATSAAFRALVAGDLPTHTHGAADISAGTFPSGTFTFQGNVSFTAQQAIRLQSMGDFGHASFHDSILLTNNIRYDGSGDPTDVANYTYIADAGVNNKAGGLVWLRGNGTETGVTFGFYSAPTSTGAGAAPASLTMRFEVTSALAKLGNGVGLQMNGTTVLTSARALQNVSMAGGSGVTIDAALLTSGTLPSARVTGSYTGITAVGSLTSLTVTGAVTIGTNQTLALTAPAAGTGHISLNAYTDTTTYWSRAARNSAYGTASEQNSLRWFYYNGTSFVLYMAFEPVTGQIRIDRTINIANTEVLTAARELKNVSLASTSGVTIDAALLTSGTLASARLTGSYTGITAVGTLTSLTTSGTFTSTAAGVTVSSTGHLRVATGFVLGWRNSGDTANVTLTLNDTATFSGPISATTIAGTLTTAAQPNITSVGTLTSLTVSGATALQSTLTVATQTAFGPSTSIASNIQHWLRTTLTSGGSANAIGVYLNGTLTAGAATHVLYGMRLDTAFSNGGFANVAVYGLYINDVGANGATNYQLYSAGARPSYFAGSLESNSYVRSTGTGGFVLGELASTARARYGVSAAEVFDFLTASNTLATLRALAFQAVDAAAASSLVAEFAVTGDGNRRLTMTAGGKLTWGPGSAVGDVSLERSSAGIVRVNGTLNATVAVTSDLTMTAQDFIFA
jgi:hypothetical protein